MAIISKLSAQLFRVIYELQLSKSVIYTKGIVVEIVDLKSHISALWYDCNLHHDRGSSGGPVELCILCGGP